ncbi:MAG: SCO family protein [Verrucomicrobiales bacterium]|nr:SCO family protein [Verrucomicrobiales bacterium]
MKRAQHLLWAGFVVALAVLTGVALHQYRKEPAPGVFGQVGPFQLTNQLSSEVGLNSLQGDVVVANVIFSRCPSQCHRLSQQMARIQSRTGPGIRLVSLTADPDYDRPDILRHYGERYGADPARWWFLTGPKAEVYRFAEKDLLFTVMDTGEKNPKLEDRFIHSGNYVILDRQGRLRGVVQSEEAGAEKKVVSLARRLQADPNL